jgi:hypothetical protein
MEKVRNTALKMEAPRIPKWRLSSYKPREVTITTTAILSAVRTSNFTKFYFVCILLFSFLFLNFF